MVGRLQHVRYRQVLWTPLVCSDNHKQSECTTTVWVHNRGFRLLDMHEPTRCCQYLTCATSCSESVHESPTKGEEEGRWT